MSRFLTHLTTLDFHLRMLLLVVPTAIAGSIALWAALSKQHWFWRGLSIYLTILTLVPIRAYEPAFVWFITLPMIILASRLVNDIRRPGDVRTLLYSKMRLKLADVFMFTLIFGLALQTWILIADSDGDFFGPYALTAGAITGVCVFASKCVTARQRRSQYVFFLLGTVIACAFAVPAVGSGIRENIWGVVGVTFHERRSMPDIATVGMALLELALFVAVITSLATACFAHPVKSVRRIATLSIVVLAIAIAIPLALTYSKMRGFAPFPPDMQGETNNFTKLGELGRRHDAMKRGTRNEKSRDTLRRLICRDAVPLLDAPNFIPFAPKRLFESAVPTGDPAEDERILFDPYRRIQLEDLLGLFNLDKALDEEADTAFLADDFDQYARLKTAQLRLAGISMRGGLLEEAYKGLERQLYVQRHLAAVRRKLSPNGAQVVIGGIEWIQSECEPTSIVLARDAAFMQQRRGWPERLTQTLPGPSMFSPLPYADVFHQTNTIATLLKTELAIQVFQKKQMRWPNQLDELVPNQLTSVPVDPYSNQPLRYRVVDNKYLLYSIGPDAHDDGGKFAGWNNFTSGESCDIDLDVLTRPSK